MPKIPELMTSVIEREQVSMIRNHTLCYRVIPDS